MFRYSTQSTSGLGPYKLAASMRSPNPTAFVEPTGFGPNSVGGLVYWFDASRLPLTDGDKVSSWTDYSGRSAHAVQSDSAKQPVYKTNIINGKPVVRFPETGGEHLLLTSASLANGTAMFFVGNFSTLQTASAFPIALRTTTTDTAAGDTFLVWRATSANVGIAWRGAAFQYTTTGSWSGNILATVRINSIGGGQMQFIYRLNGTTIGSSQTGAGTTLAPTNGALGGRFEPPSPYNIVEWSKMDLAEFFMYSSSLSAGDVTNIESYLNSKYSIY